jgi:phage-related protein
MAETANVEILIEAFTEAAEQALDDVGDEMNNLAADTAPANAASRELGDALDSLERSADDAGDEISQAGRRAAVTSGLFGSLTISTEGLSLAMGTLSTAMTLSLIPALLTLSTVLLPLASILAGVAAAGISLAAVFGGLAAVGVVTHMKELKEALADARAEIMEIIAPLGEVFGPLLVDAVEALPELVRRIVDSLGPLNQFADGLRTLGQEAMTAIPAMTGVMFDLAEQALPVVIDLFRQLQETGPGLMDAVAEAVDRLGGPLMALGGALGDLLPTLHEVGIIVGELVFPALTDLFNLIDQGVEAFLSLGENLRELGVAGAISAPAIFGVASAIGSLTGPLGVAAAAVLAFVAAYRSNFLGIQEVTDDVIGGVIDTFREYVDAVRPAVEGVIDVLMAYGNAIRDAFQSGSGTAISGLIDNIQGLASQYVSLVGDIANQVLPIFDIVAGTLRSNSDQFAAFGRMAINAVNGLVTVIRTVFLPAIRFVLMNFTIPLITRLARVWSNNFGAILSETIQTINAIRSFIQPALTALGNFWTSHGDTITSAVKFAFDAIIGIIGTALDAVYTIILVALNLIQGDWQEAIRLIADFFVDAFIGLTEFIQDWGIIDAFQNAVRAMISGVVTLITQTLPELFIQGLATVFTIIQNFGSSLGNTLIMIFNGVVGIIVDAINGLITTATDAINSILETINTVADEVSEIPGVDDVSLDTLDAATIDASSIQQDRGAIVNQRDRERNAQAIRAAVDLTINGTGALADLLREETDASVETSRRADTRRLRRQGVDR